MQTDIKFLWRVRASQRMIINPKQLFILINPINSTKIKRKKILMEKLLKRKNENMYKHNMIYMRFQTNEIIHCRVQTQLHINFVETQKDNTYIIITNINFIIIYSY